MQENQTSLNKQGSSKSLNELIKSAVKGNIRQYTMFIALLFIGLIFTFLTHGIFISSRNLSNLMLQTATTAILACGMVLVIVGGHIDLSAGSVVAFTGAVAAILQVKHGWGTLPVIAVALFVGLLVGLWQGYWVASKGVPAFIVTLGGQLIFRGAVIAITKGETIAPLKKSFSVIGQGYLPRLFLKTGHIHDTTLILGVICIISYIIYETRKRKTRINYGFEVLPKSLQFLKLVAVSLLIGVGFMIMITYLGMPYCILLLIILVLFYVYITNSTTFGRYVYAIGGNKEAARLSGINIKKVNMYIFISMGILSAIAGVVFTGRLNSATASAGNNFELDAIASCFIGGASTMGGEGTIIGAMIGALVMSVINNGMSLMNVPQQYQQIVKGLILILAVWVDITSKKKRS